MAGAPKENTNAEKWTLNESLSFMQLALKTAKDEGYDFIGEVASHLDTYREIFVYLKDKFPECNTLYKRLEQQCESNCFSHAKKGDIVPSLGIINLKSNHGWTDRMDNTTKGEKLPTPILTNDPLSDDTSDNGITED